MKACRFDDRLGGDRDRRNPPAAERWVDVLEDLVDKIAQAVDFKGVNALRGNRLDVLQKDVKTNVPWQQLSGGWERFLYIVAYAPEKGFEGSFVEEWTTIGSSGRENLHEVGRPHWNVVGQCDEGNDDWVLGDGRAFK